MLFKRGVLLLLIGFGLLSIKAQTYPHWRDSLAVMQWVDTLLNRAEQDAWQEVRETFSQAWADLAGADELALARLQVGFGLGECFHLASQPDSALHWYAKVIDLGEQIWNRPTLLLSRVYNGQAIAHVQAGRYQQAYEVSAQVLALRRDLLASDDPDLAQAHNNLAIMSYQAEHYDSCLHHMARAVDIWEQVEPIPLNDLLSAYNNLGIITDNLGDSRGAIRWYKRILPYADTMPPNSAAHQISLANVYNNLAQSYRRLGDWAQAILYHRQSLDLERTYPSQDPRALGIKYDNLGGLFMTLGEVDSSLHYLQAGLAHKQAHLPPDHSLIYDSYQILGRLWLGQGRPQEALRFFRRILPHYQRLYPEGSRRLANLYLLLGKTYLALGDTGQALVWNEQSVAKHQRRLKPYHPDLREAHLVLARTLHGIDTDRAWEQLEAAQATGEDLYPIAIEAGTTQGDWHRELAQWPQAWQAYRLALRLSDSLWRRYQHIGSETRLMNAVRPAQWGALTAGEALFAQTGDTALLREAWRLSEQSRALGLREALQGVEARNFATLPDSIFAFEEKLRHKLQQVERQLARAEQREDADAMRSLRQERFELLTQQETWLAQLALEAPEMYRLRFDHRSPDLNALQDWLAREDRDLIEYFIYQNQGFALLLRPDTLHLIRLACEVPLEEEVLRLRRSLFDQGRPVSRSDSFADIAHRLYRALIAPIDAEVSDLRESLVIVPDGPLGYLPFELLLDRPVAPGTAWGQLPYWLRRHELSYAYAADWLLRRQGHSQASKSLLALAPDTEQPHTLIQAVSLQSSAVPLRHHWDEARHVADHWGGEVWLHAAASEAALKRSAEAYRILHFATHAAVDDRFPTYSFLQLAPGKGEDGLLEIVELYGLSLDADLVVLSACQTGVGRYRHGDGIVSLGQGFSYAGARSVLMTLWTVNDELSGQLMRRMYAGLTAGRTRAAALREAQLTMLASGDPLAAHPFYWAGYRLSGQPGPLTPAQKATWPWWLAAALGGLLVLGIWWRKMN